VVTTSSIMAPRGSMSRPMTSGRKPATSSQVNDSSVGGLDGLVTCMTTTAMARHQAAKVPRTETIPETCGRFRVKKTITRQARKGKAGINHTNE